MSQRRCWEFITCTTRPSGWQNRAGCKPPLFQPSDTTDADSTRSKSDPESSGPAWKDQQPRPVVDELSEFPAEFVEARSFVNQPVGARSVELIDSILHGIGRKHEHRRKRPAPQDAFISRGAESFARGYCEAVWRQTSESFIRCLENAFRHFGGVTATVVIDNLKAGVIQADWFPVLVLVQLPMSSKLCSNCCPAISARKSNHSVLHPSPDP